MALNITQDDYNILRQSYIKQYIKLDLLDFNMNVVDELSGNLIGLSVTVYANAELRRSCECSLDVTDKPFALTAFNVLSPSPRDSNVVVLISSSLIIFYQFFYICILCGNIYSIFLRA